MKKLFLFLIFGISFLYAQRIVTDQMNRQITLPNEVNRVIVLQHQTLNIINQIGAANKVVGVLESWKKNLGDGYQRLMPGIENLPTPGDLKSVNYEAILALKPDVVFVANYIDKEYINKLTELGVPVVVVSFFVNSKKGANTVNIEFENPEKSYDEGLYQGIELIGEILGKNKNAKELIEYVKASQEELKTITSKIPSNSKIKIYMANPNFTTYGSGKYTGIIFNRAGGVNVAEKEFKGYKEISKEKFIDLNPEVIFIQDRYPQVADELKDSSIKSVAAIKNNRIYMMPEYAKAWGYPTPEAMALGEFWVAKKLYPEILKDFNLDKKVDEYYKKFYRTNYKK